MALKALMSRGQAPGARTIRGAGWVAGMCLAQNLSLSPQTSQAGALCVPDGKGKLTGAGELFGGVS